jgi:hypothetical protein
LSIPPHEKEKGFHTGIKVTGGSVLFEKLKLNGFEVGLAATVNSKVEVEKYSFENNCANVAQEEGSQVRLGKGKTRENKQEPSKGPKYFAGFRFPDAGSKSE